MPGAHAAPPHAAITLIFACVLATFLQVRVSSLQLTSDESKPVTLPDSCECWKWKNAYYRNEKNESAVYCGEYSEFGAYTFDHKDLTSTQLYGWIEDHHDVYEEICTRYLEKLDNNYCIPFNEDDIAEGSWCYVNAGCTDIQGGKGGGRLRDKMDKHGHTLYRNGTGWKKCNAERNDTLMNEMTPVEVMNMTAHFGIKNLNTVFAHIYHKVYPVKHLWGEIEDDWNKCDYTRFDDTIKDTMYNGGLPVIVFNETKLPYWNHSHYKLFYGLDVYSLDEEPAMCPNTTFCYNKIVKKGCQWPTRAPTPVPTPQPTLAPVPDEVERRAILQDSIPQ